MTPDLRLTGVTYSDNQIDEICDAYESDWSGPDRPSIKTFLDQCDEAHRAELFYELLLVELESRHNRGERPTMDEYLAEFPQFAEQIEAANFYGGGSAFATVAFADEQPPRTTTHQPGSRIDHFELVELLGTGAMGEVWKAQDSRLRRFVALKLPRAETLTEADLRRFLREGQAAAQLRHPRLAAVHQVGREGKTVFIVADYVEGENLKKYLAAHALTHAEMAELCADVAEALHHAHEHEVVHRDLKPANIIVDQAGKPHVIDFGLAKWSNDDRDLTLRGELLGTPAYMSPEQAGGNASNLDRRTDVYSLGVILYELLTGQCPFTGEMGSVIHQIIAVEPPPVRKLNVKAPRDLETICLKALDKNPDRRYATMQEMAVDLRRFARGEPILSRRAGPLERSWRWSRRRPGLSAAMLAIVLILSTSAAVYRSNTHTIRRLQGFRPVRIHTTPSGARVAIVRPSNVTGEPNPDGAGILRPQEKTPFNISLQPGNYLIEAVLPGANQQVEVAEISITIPPAGRISDTARVANRASGYDEDLFRLTVDFSPRANSLRKMLAVPIAENLRRENPLLPKLLYVDAEETRPKVQSKSTKRYFTFSGAQFEARARGNRLASEAEYQAIELAARNNQIFDPETGQPAQLVDFFGGVAEWTTTKYRDITYRSSDDPKQFQDNRVLAGYGDPDTLRGLKRTLDNKLIFASKDHSAVVGFRGVRSGTPRFVIPE